MRGGLGALGGGCGPLRGALGGGLGCLAGGRASLISARAVRAALRSSLAALRTSLSPLRAALGARAVRSSLGPLCAALGALFGAPAKDGLLRSGLRGDILLGLTHFLAVNGYRGRAVVGGEGRDDVKTYAGEGEGVGVAGSLREGFVTGVVTLSPVLTSGVLPRTGEGEERSVRVVVDGGLDRRRP